MQNKLKLKLKGPLLCSNDVVYIHHALLYSLFINLTWKWF